jgi:ketosteroid isomerase-like protein
MRRLLAAIVFVAAGCATAPSAAFFTDLEHRWVAALQAHDTAALNEILDDSFVDSTFRGGTRTKHDVLTGPPAGGAYKSVRLDDVNVRAYGRDTVIVTGVNVLSGPAGDTVRVRFTDVFRKSTGRWRAVAAQETMQTVP